MSQKGKTIGTESHVYDELGQLEGLWTIDGHKVRNTFGARKYWEGIDEIVRLYRQINPTEMAVTKIENDTQKTDNKNDFGSNDTKVFRHALNIPHGLYYTLIDYDPQLFRNKKTRTAFMKRFPDLRSCITV